MNVKQISNIMNKYPEFIPQSRTQIDVVQGITYNEDNNEFEKKYPSGDCLIVY